MINFRADIREDSVVIYSSIMQVGGRTRLIGEEKQCDLDEVVVDFLKRFEKAKITVILEPE